MNPSPQQPSQTPNQAGSIIYLTHGGGPLPLLGDPGHHELVDFLRDIPAALIKPAAILVISAHWEEALPTITGGTAPELFFDYYGFPEESYTITYPAPGAPQLAAKIRDLFRNQGLAAEMDDSRGYDHGVFIPLKLMYPDARIPCLQVSLLEELRPQDHLRLGAVLGQLRHENLLIVGSGSSFHNLRAFRETPSEAARQANEAFEQWLAETLGDRGLKEEERERRLLHWEQAPAARYCHPREEHLLPLHVCYGIAGGPAARIYRMEVMGKKVSAFVW